MKSCVCGHSSGQFCFPGTISQEELRGKNIILHMMLMCCCGLSGENFFPTLMHTTTHGKSSALLFRTCPSDSAPCVAVVSLLSPPAQKSKPCVWCERALSNLTLIGSLISFPEPRYCLKWAEREYSLNMFCALFQIYINYDNDVALQLNMKLKQ